MQAKWNSESIMVKHLYIIAGCNGAGKTTASTGAFTTIVIIKVKELLLVEKNTPLKVKDKVKFNVIKDYE